MTVLLILLSIALFAACHPDVAERGRGVNHATLLNIEEEEGYTRVDVRDAWNAGRALQSYILVPRDSALPPQMPGGTLLRTPLRRVVPFSAAHAALLMELGKEETIIAMCDTGYVITPTLRNALREKRIAHAGNSAHPDAERLLSLHPEALFVAPMQNGRYATLEEAGLQLVMCTDYMETTPLGRAEWMRFFGLLMGCENRADSLFNNVVASYNSLKEKTTKIKQRPTLLCDTKQGAAWHVPGGGSYLGQLYADAGLNYIFGSYEQSGSVALNFETVFSKAAAADFWFIKYASPTTFSYESLAADNVAYKRFTAWQNRRIYGCNTLEAPFYEEVPFHPERLLRDVISICHPQLLPRHKLRYFLPLR